MLNKVLLNTFLFATAVGSLLACAVPTSTISPSETFEIDGYFTTVRWISQTGLIGQKDDDSIWLIDGDGNLIRQLIFLDDPLCTRRTIYGLDTILPDDRIGLIKLCFGRWPNATVADQDAVYLLGYDVQTDKISNLVSKPLPMQHVTSMAWNPNVTHGIILQSNGLQGAVYWVDVYGRYPITATVTDGTRTWPLSLDFETILEGNIQNAGLPGEINWSPDGNTVAFWGSLDAIGRTGLDSADGAWSLYFMSPTTQQPQPVLQGVYRPERLAWSRDGKWLAFFGQPGANQVYGLWVFSPTKNQLWLVTDNIGFNTLSIDWSPDSTQLLQVHCGDEVCASTQAFLYDTSSIIASQ